jgi:hypothetical protein
MYKLQASTLLSTHCVEVGLDAARVGACATRNRVFKGVRMVLRATKGHKDALGGSPRINGLERVFKGVPMALRATKGRENRGRERYAH